MATNKVMKILLIMLALIGLGSFISLPAVATPKWLIPDGLKTIEVNGYVGRGTFVLNELTNAS